MRLAIPLIVLATANAVVVATEFIVVGLLPMIARDMLVSVTTAGYLISGFALSATLLGPPLALAVTVSTARRTLVAVLLLYGGTNFAAALSPSFPALLLLRIVQGAMLPVFLGAGAAAITHLVPPERRGRAMALANTGFAAGLVIALPAGVALASGGAWTYPLAALSIASVAAAALVAALFPRISSPGVRARSTPFVWTGDFLLHLALTVAIFAGMFSAYAYIAVWLRDVGRLDSGATALALAAFGGAGIVGNTLAAFTADRAPLRSTGIAAVILGVATAGFTGIDVLGSRIGLFLIWGAAHTANVVLCQVRVTAAGRPTPAFAMALNISAANLGIALGTVAGGMVIAAGGIAAIGWGPLIMLPVTGLLLATLVRRRISDSLTCGGEAE